MNDKTQTYREYTENTYTVSYPVGLEDDGLRIDQFLLERYSTFSREFIKKKISNADIYIQNRSAKTKPSTKVKKGERVVVVTHRSHLEDEWWRGEKIKFIEPTIIFEDEDLFVLSKPPFMSTHPVGKHLFHCATVWLEQRFNHSVNSIHRLDRETSGILLMAKNPPTANDLTDAFEERKVSKTYFLIAHKNSNAKDFPFIAKENLATQEERLITHCYPQGSSNGKESETRFELLEQNEKYILALAFPRTGRQHQIRAHSAHHGYPLLGDKIYHGGSDVFSRFKDLEATKEDHDLMKIPRQALHAISLRFPYKGSTRIFIDKVPEDLAEWIIENFAEIDLESLNQKIQGLIKS